MSRPVARAGELRALSHRQQHLVAFDVQSAGEVDGVVASQGVLAGEIAGSAGERFVDRDDAQLGVKIFEGGDRTDMRRLIDAARARKGA